MSLARKIVTVGSGTLASRVLAFVRDAWIAAWLGAGPFAEAFFAMLQVINFFRRLLADGALNGAFVPIWLALCRGGEGEANANRFTRASLLAMFCTSGIVALLAIVFGRYAIAAIAPGFDEQRQTLATFLLFMAAPYIVLAGLVAVISAALNAENRVGAVTLSTISFNLVMLLALFLAFDIGLDLFYATAWIAFAVTAAGFVQLVITATAWLLTGHRFRRPSIRVPDETRQLFRRAGPGLIAAGIPQLKLIAAAAIVSSSPAAVSWLYYANRLYELPLGVASIAIAAVIVPRLAAALREDGAALAKPEAQRLEHEQSRALELALGLALPAAAGFAVLAHPIAAGLFERGAFTEGDSIAVAAALTAICAGLPGHTLEKMFGAVSYAHEDTRTPMIAALCGLATAIAGGLLLFPQYGYVGAAAAIAISGWVGATLLCAILYARGWLRFDAATAYRLPGIALATAVMAIVVHYGLKFGERLYPAASLGIGGRLIALAALVTLGLAVYLGALHILRVATLRDLMQSFRRD